MRDFPDDPSVSCVAALADRPVNSGLKHSATGSNESQNRLQARLSLWPRMTGGIWSTCCALRSLHPGVLPKCGCFHIRDILSFGRGRPIIWRTPGRCQTDSAEGKPLAEGSTCKAHAETSNRASRCERMTLPRPPKIEIPPFRNSGRSPGRRLVLRRRRQADWYWNRNAAIFLRVAALGVQQRKGTRGRRLLANQATRLF